MWSCLFLKHISCQFDQKLGFLIKIFSFFLFCANFHTVNAIEAVYVPALIQAQETLEGKFFSISVIFFLFFVCQIDLMVVEIAVSDISTS